MKPLVFFFFFTISCCIASFGHPTHLPILGILAATIGYALFWKCLFSYTNSLVKIFWKALVWFSLVLAIDLFWMTSIEYQGIYILFVYAGLVFTLSALFGFFTLLFSRLLPLTIEKAVFLSSIWVLLEWARMTILCGFSLHFVGMSLSCFIPSLQMASIFGVLGMSFYVMFTNLIAFKTTEHAFSKKRIIIFLTIAIFPFVFGWINLKFHELFLFDKKNCQQTLHVALVQTGLTPSQKQFLEEKSSDYISPYEQWNLILRLFKQKKSKKVDLIVLPEAAVPLLARAGLYAEKIVKQLFIHEFGNEVINFFPPFIAPYAEYKKETEKWFVSNLFWAQTLSNFFSSELIIGLDEKDEDKNYNAVFHLLPNNGKISRYEKRILLPLAESLPWNFLKILTKAYGICEFFSEGKEAKIFSGKILMSPSVCYEETNPALIREGRNQGANLFVNLTNDGWYPRSSLPFKHLMLGRLRAIENGVSLIRSCNTGATAIVDSFGRILSILKNDQGDVENVKGILEKEVPLYQYKTLFTKLGNHAILVLALFSCFSYFLRHTNFFIFKRSFYSMSKKNNEA